MLYQLYYVISVLVLAARIVAVPLSQPSPKTNLIEGDIVMTKSLSELINPKQRDKREITTNPIKRWSNKVVPYVIDSAIGKSGRSAVQQAIKEFHYHTCIQFVQRTTQKDYITFQRDTGCYSPIGRQGGRQVLSVGQECEKRGVIMHELMHALGFFHEHSRYDRDKYVRILWWNIKPDFFPNFESYSHADLDTLNIAYDYDSLMHYDRQAFSKNRENTIEAIHDANKQLGQMINFSKKDIQQLVKAYRCETTTRGIPTQQVRMTTKDLNSRNQQYQRTLPFTKIRANQENKEDKSIKPKGVKCKDMFPWMCKKFAAGKGYCDHWKNFMLERCPAACGFCQPLGHFRSALMLY